MQATNGTCNNYPAYAKRNKAIRSKLQMVSSIRTQTHLKPYTLQKKMAQPMEQPECNHALPNHKPLHVTTSRPKRDTKTHVKLDL